MSLSTFVFSFLVSSCLYFVLNYKMYLKDTLLLSDHGFPFITSRDILEVTFCDTLYIWTYRTKYRQSSHRASDKGRLNPRQTRSPLPPPPLFSRASPSSPLYSTICHQLHHHHLQHHCFHVYHISLITTECNVWGQT